MDALRQDLAFAIRVLRRDRAYAAAVILTLAICLGANTAIFTVVRSVLLRSLPYPESDRLVSSFDSFPGAGVERAGTSVPNYVDRRAMIDVFSGAALYQWSGYRGGGKSPRGSSSLTNSWRDASGRIRIPWAGACTCPIHRRTLRSQARRSPGSASSASSER